MLPGSSATMKFLANYFDWKGKEDFYCDTCLKTYPDPMVHLKTHLVCTLFTCGIAECDLMTTSPESFLMHIQDTEGAHPFTYTCLRCNHTEKKLKLYISHLKNHREMTVKQHLERHAKLRTMGAVNVTDTELSGVPSNAHRTNFRCSVCDEIVPHTSWTEHMGDHMKYTSFKCIHCDTNWSDYDFLNQHRLHCSQKFLYRCQLCALEVHGNFHAYTAHVRTHNFFSCFSEACSAKFATYAEAIDHSLEHYDYANFYCRVCFGMFHSYTSIIHHTHKTHKTLESTNSVVGCICKLCGTIVINPGQIYNHISMHGLGWQAEKPLKRASFKCRTLSLSLRYFGPCELRFDDEAVSCDATFKDADSLCAHVKRHILTPAPAWCNGQSHVVDAPTATKLLMIKEESKNVCCEPVDQSDNLVDIKPVIENQLHSLFAPQLRVSEVVSLSGSIHLKQMTTSTGAATHLRQGRLRKKLCEICGILLHNPRLQLQHILQHFEGAVFYCRVCFETYDTYQKARDHYITHDRLTLGWFGVGILCHICGEIVNCSERTEIVDHLLQHKREGSNCADEAVFECKTLTVNLPLFSLSEIRFEDDARNCNAMFTNAQSLCAHVKKHILPSPGQKPGTVAKSKGAATHPGRHGLKNGEASQRLQRRTVSASVTSHTSSEKVDKSQPLNMSTSHTSSKDNNVDKTTKKDCLKRDLSGSVINRHSISKTEVKYAEIPPSPPSLSESVVNGHPRTKLEEKCIEISLHPQSDNSLPAPKMAKIEVKREENGQSFMANFPPKTKIKIYPCQVCGKRFIEERFFRLHLDKTGH